MNSHSILYSLQFLLYTKWKLKLFIIMGTACIWQSWPACLDVHVQLFLHDNGNHTGRCKLWAPVFRTSDSMPDYMCNWVQYMRQFTIDVVSIICNSPTYSGICWPSRWHYSQYLALFPGPPLDGARGEPGNRACQYHHPWIGYSATYSSSIVGILLYKVYIQSVYRPFIVRFWLGEKARNAHASCEAFTIPMRGFSFCKAMKCVTDPVVVCFWFSPFSWNTFRAQY